MVSVSELLQPFRRDDSAPHSQLPDLAVGVFGVVGCCELEKRGEIASMCMDNNSAVGWIRKGDATIGLSRDIASSFDIAVLMKSNI